MIRDRAPFLLSRAERGILGALVEALYDPRATGVLVTREITTHVIGEVEAWLAAPDVVVRSIVRAFLADLELSPVRFGFGAKRMSRLSRHERVRYLEARSDGGASRALGAWKTLLGSAYFAHPVGAGQLDAREIDRRTPDMRLHASIRARRALPVLEEIAAQ